MVIQCEYIIIYADGTWETERNIPLEMPDDADPTDSAIFELAGEYGDEASYRFQGAITAYPWCVPQAE